jgi:hypothetical protein
LARENREGVERGEKLRKKEIETGGEFYLTLVDWKEVP